MLTVSSLALISSQITIKLVIRGHFTVESSVHPNGKDLHLFDLFIYLCFGCKQPFNHKTMAKNIFI